MISRPKLRADPSLKKKAEEVGTRGFGTKSSVEEKRNGKTRPTTGHKCQQKKAT